MVAVHAELTIIDLVLFLHHGVGRRGELLLLLSGQTIGFLAGHGAGPAADTLGDVYQKRFGFCHFTTPFRCSLRLRSDQALASEAASADPRFVVRSIMPFSAIRSRTRFAGTA